MGRMKRRTLAFVLAAPLWLLGCATTPRTVEVSQAQLQAALDRKFPSQVRLLELLDVQLTAPRLTLQPEAGRLRTDFALQVSDRILRRSLQGQLDLSFGLRYEPTDASVRMREVRVERMDLRGLPEAWVPYAQRIGPLAAERLLEGAVLHTFTPEQLARANGWTPGELRVTRGGVAITLLPPVR
jgi:hypothetical protein